MVDDLWPHLPALVCAATVAAFTLHELLRVAAFFANTGASLSRRIARPHVTRLMISAPGCWQKPARYQPSAAFAATTSRRREDNEEPKRTGAAGAG